MAELALGEIRFYECPITGLSAFSERGGTCFISMQFTRSNDLRAWGRTPERKEAPYPKSTWHVNDCLVDAAGNFWFRHWQGVMDDFGTLLEVTQPEGIDEIPF